MMNFFKQMVHFWKTGLVFLFILILCLIPSNDLQKIDLLKISYEDLAVHLVMFIAFSAFLFGDLRRNAMIYHSNKVLSIYVFSSGILLGILTEILQFILVSLHRTASLTDLVFDLAGTALGITYMVIIKR